MGFSTSVKANAGANLDGAPMSVSGPVPAGGSPGGWHPTILYMVALIAAEIIAVALLSKWILK